MKNSLEYIFKRDGVVHVLKIAPSNNKKLGTGNIVSTYHFSEDQVKENDFKLDSKNCFNCPYSHNQGSSNCYTHKGPQHWGLVGMLKKLNKLPIQEFQKESFEAFLYGIETLTPKFCRFGVYGEPITLQLSEIKLITDRVKNFTGYTHQWGNSWGYEKYFMASTHSLDETSLANKLGWRAFETSKVENASSPLCPASKEFKGNKLTCIQCVACNGKIKNKSNNIFIKNH